MIGESLTLALPYATRLDTIHIGASVEISLSTVQSIFSTCGATLVNVTCLNVKGTRGGFIADSWATVNSMKRLNLKADKDSCLDIVSFS